MYLFKLKFIGNCRAHHIASTVAFIIVYLSCTQAIFFPHRYRYFRYLKAINDHRMELFVDNFSTALATSCQVYPSEYTYKDDSSVDRAESASANCRMHPPSNAEGSVHPEDYIHCDGT